MEEEVENENEDNRSFQFLQGMFNPNQYVE